MDSNIKLSNVLGAPFQSFVLQQFDQRANHNSSNNRDLNEILFLANKTAWVRLASSVNVIGRTLSKVEDNKTPKPYDVTTDQVYKALGVGTYSTEDDLAKSWVLEAGTSVEIGDGGDGINLRSGISANNNADLTGTTLGAYGLGGTQELGFVPMPGLTSVTIETLGRLGSLRQATVNFRVNNLNQLNVIEALYFRLGYSMILEWGHTQYYLNNGNFETKNIYGIDDIFNNNLRKEDIIAKINAKTRATDGNYGGMYGIVTNFNWNATQDGGYDCSVKLIGHGAIMDSLKTNQSYTLPNGVIQQFQKFEDFILDKIAKDTQTIKELQAKLEAGVSGTNVTVEEFFPPEPAAKNLEDLTKVLYKYSLAERLNIPYSTETYKAAIREFAWPIPTKEVFKDPYFLEQRTDKKGFITYVPDSFFNLIASDKARAAYVKRFAGYYIQKGSEFVRIKVGGDVLRANINMSELDAQLGLAGFNAGQNGRTFYRGGTIAENDLGLGPTNSNLEKLISWEIARGSSTPDTITTPGWPAEIATEYGNYAPLVRTTEFTLGEIVQSGRTQKRESVGHYTFKLQYTYPANNLYQPGKVQIADAIAAFYNSISGSPKTLNGGVSVGRIANPDVQPNSAEVVFNYNFNATFNFNVTVPNVAYSGPADQAELTARAEGIDPKNNVKNVPVQVIVTTTNLSIFDNFTVNGAPYSPEPTAATTGNTGDTKGTVNESNTSQEKAPEGFSSALQAMLTIVQTESQAAALQKTGVYVHNILGTTRKFYTDGTLNNVFNAAGETTVPDMQAIKDKRFNLLNYAIKGFNSAIMADDSIYEEIPFVDFKTLCKSYVIKYKQGGLESVINDVRSPTYITLGYLLAFLNNMCLIYDSNKSRKKTTEQNTTSTGDKKHPFLYIDFNPKTNFCFTLPQQFSIDPTVCMVPMQKGQKYYKKLFSTDEIIKNLDPAIFNTEVNNVVTQDLIKGGANFTADDGTDSARYKGNLMNILLNTQYLLDLCLNMSRNDAEHAVNLKPFLDQILIDVNKSLGGVNSFRASYIDDSNTIQIVDDQWVPLEEGNTAGGTIGQSTMLNQQGLASKEASNPTTAGQLPLDGSIIASAAAPGSISVIGTKSMTREFRFNTLISSKLASKIAISAQAETLVQKRILQ